MKKVTLALADDHNLVRSGIAGLISGYDNYEVIIQASTGQELINQIGDSKVPDIVLLDIHMPDKDGYETCLWLRNQYPDIRVLALSMYDKEHTIIRMLRNGARGYLLKDVDPKEFRTALDVLVKTGYYYSGMITNRLIHALNKMDDPSETIQSITKLNETETGFLVLCASELTYKEIADKMGISPRAVDSIREALFEKLAVKSRIGLVIFAIKHGFVTLT